MIRSELVARVAILNPHLYARDVERVVDTILGRIETALAQGDRVELRDFGTFSMKHRAARTGRNPRTGASVAISEKTAIHFKPGQGMRRRLNGDAVEPASETRRQRFA